MTEKSNAKQAYLDFAVFLQYPDQLKTPRGQREANTCIAVMQKLVDKYRLG